MNILAVDTAGKTAGVALLQDDRPVKGGGPGPSGRMTACCTRSIWTQV